MAKIFVTHPIPGAGVDMLRESKHEVAVNRESRFLSRDELLEAVVGCAGLLTQLREAIDAEVFDAAGDQLKVVSNYAVGFNNIDVDEATRREITVCNTPGVLTEATADIAWTLLMGVARRAVEGDHIMRAGDWSGWKPTELLGGDIEGRTLAILGAGRIGTAVARRSIGWNMKLMYTARSPKPDMEALGARHVDLETALREADFVSVHVPLTPDTHHLLNADRLAMMKPTAYLINTARGPVIDESALVVALKTGKLAGAGLDVYEDEPALKQGLTGCDNTLLLPHLGSATIQTRARMSELAARNLLTVLDNQAPPHAVNQIQA
ncbi:D-glycerate dehydrogenase [Planctomycetales bacterium ZRK34]|nr:D-glycerate dehydrogenase [Planctomycetales bacterium ZRK34]